MKKLVGATTLSSLRGAAIAMVLISSAAAQQLRTPEAFASSIRDLQRAVEKKKDLWDKSQILEQERITLDNEIGIYHSNCGGRYLSVSEKAQCDATYDRLASRKENVIKEYSELIESAKDKTRRINVLTGIIRAYVSINGCYKQFADNNIYCASLDPEPAYCLYEALLGRRSTLLTVTRKEVC